MHALANAVIVALALPDTLHLLTHPLDAFGESDGLTQVSVLISLQRVCIQISQKCSSTGPILMDLLLMIMCPAVDPFVILEITKMLMCPAVDPFPIFLLEFHPQGVVMAIHLYHVLGFKLSWDDKIHHGVSVGVVGTMGYMFRLGRFGQTLSPCTSVSVYLSLHVSMRIETHAHFSTPCFLSPSVFTHGFRPLSLPLEVSEL